MVFRRPKEGSATTVLGTPDAPDALRHTPLVKFVHRIQALLVSALYRCVNGSLCGLAILLWPRQRPVVAERVCIFRIGNIGDIVCALPAMRCVRQVYPNARLTLLTSAGAIGMLGAAELLPGTDWIDELRVYHSEDIQTYSQRWNLIKELRGHHFDVWIELPNSLSPILRQFRDMIFAWMTGVRWARGWRVGTLRVAAQAQSEHLGFTNEVDRMLAIVERAGIPLTGIDFGLPRLAVVRTRIDELIHAKRLRNHILVAIAPGAKRSTNHWPQERFVEVGRLLDDGNTAIVLISGRTEAELCEGLAAQMGAHAHSFAGGLSLPESLELLRRCRLLICVDSGVQHLAAAVGTPCLSLFSFWQLRGQWRPHGDKNVVIQKWVPCHTCLLDNCPLGNACMKAIDVEEVIGQAARMLGTDLERALLIDASRRASAETETAAQGRSP